MYRYLKLMVITALLLILVQNTAFANHTYSPKRHLSSMGSSTESEYFCVDTSASTLASFSTAYTTLENILYNSSYDGLAGGKINFVGSTYATQCGGFSAGDLAFYNMRYYIKTNTSPACDGTSSCVIRSAAVTVNGHSHYSYEIATIRQTPFTNIPGYMVNHETGHIMGMLDGDQTCPGSIMHSKDYGCTALGYPATPTSLDITTVTAEANSN
jgi:hypothetical protein